MRTEEVEKRWDIKMEGRDGDSIFNKILYDLSSPNEFYYS